MALVQCVVPGLSFWWGMDAVLHFIDCINAVFKKKKKSAKIMLKQEMLSWEDNITQSDADSHS